MNQLYLLSKLFGLSLLIWHIAVLIKFPGLDVIANAQRGSSEAIKVITTEVIKRQNDREFRVIGTAQAIQSIDIYPQVTGIVKEVLFSADMFVEKNEILVHLDDDEQQLALQLAEVRLKDAQNLLRRYEQVINNGGITQNELTAAHNAVKTAQIELSQAQLALSKRQIKAPFSGYVGIADIHIGDRVDSNTRITGLDDRTALYIEFEVPESLLSELGEKEENKSNTLLLTTQAYPNKSFTANITAQNNRVNPEFRTRTVRARIDNSDNILLPGMSFQVDWHIRGELLAAIPEIALQWSTDGAYIWLINENKAQRTDVQVIARKGNIVLVSGEVQTGDLVVIEGVQRLRPDIEVEILGSQGETIK